MAGTYTSTRLRLLLYTYGLCGFRTVWTASCLSSAIAPLGIQSSCDCHLATHTSRHFALREMAAILFARCYKAASWYACASIRQYLASSSPTHSYGHSTRLVPYLGYQGFERERAAFPLPLSSHCQLAAGLSTLFFQGSEKFFRFLESALRGLSLARQIQTRAFCLALSTKICGLSEKIFFGAWQGTMPYQLEMDSIPLASPLWQKSPGMASPFSNFFQIFIFNYFRYLQSLLKSSMILASYISLFVLNCNACAHTHVRACVGKRTIASK